MLVEGTRPRVSAGSGYPRGRVARRRRRRQSGEMKNSLRLSVLLVGLVGINVYVFFFNHKTAPREVLNLQSTTKTMETTRREVLTADARAAREALTAEAAAKAATNTKVTEARPKTASPVALAAAPSVVEPAAEPAAPPVAEAAIELPPPAAPKVLAPKPDLAARTFAANTPPPHAAFQVPFAPPPEPMAARASTPHAPFQIPFAPPAEDDADAHEDSVEKKFNNADTLGQVLAREGFGPAGPQVIAAL